MKSMKTFVAVVALLALSVDAQAGLFGRWHGGFGASKGCDCAPTFQPACCRPTITRPCHVNVYNYQRACAKPFCADACAPAGACAPVGVPGAVPGGFPGAEACAPCPPVGAVPPACPPACPPVGPACCPVVDCGAPCVPCCPAVDPCEIAGLIYESQTACYAKHRAHALRRLGRKYDCVCNPEIMAAFVYALNDADERVRAQAAHEISAQVHHNPGCCSQEVVCALSVALADCDRKVRRVAERALRRCGYDVVDAGCDLVCDAACGPGCAPGGMPGAFPGTYPGAMPPAVPAEDGAADPAPAPAPAPPTEEDRAYFPKRIPQQSGRPNSIRQSLSNLFSLSR